MADKIPTLPNQGIDAPINVLNPQGELVSIPSSQVSDALNQGFTQAAPEDIHNYQLQDKYGSTGEQIKTGIEGAASAATFGGSTALEEGLGVKPEDIRGRREANPNAHMAGQVAGLASTSFIPGVGAGEILGNAGKGAAELAGLGGEGAGIASRLGAHAVSSGAENALFQAGDEMSKFLSDDPNQTAESAAANVGLAGVLGAGVGTGLGTVSEGWKSLAGSKAGKFVDDLKSQWNYRTQNLDPVEAIKNELQNYHGQISSAADEVYGAQGLKAQDIEKLLPEMNQKIAENPTSVIDSIQKTIDKLESKPSLYGDRYPQILRQSLEDYKNTLKSDELNPNPIPEVSPEPLEKPFELGNKSPADIFNATQELKQTIGKYGDFKDRVTADNPAYNAVKEVNQLYKTLKESLENKDVWGKAASRQQEINKAFSEYLPSLKDFQKKFMSKVQDEHVIDPGKINTFYNQLGKPNAELKQEMLDNFLKASGRYKNQIEKIHSNLGIDSPFGEMPLTHSERTLGKMPAGAKLADAIINKGAARLGGEALGSAAGAGIGALVGHPGIGALVGEHALGPTISSILPALAKPIMSAASSATGLKSAIEYSLQAIKGETMLGRAAKNLFKADATVLPSQVLSDDKNIKKLSDRVDELQANNGKMLDIGGSIGHYMPAHQSAVASTAMRAVNYLGSIKPNTAKLGILDPPQKPSKVAEASYNNALQIAENPILTLAKVKNGTITPEDILTVKTIYPTWYKNASGKIYQEMINHIAKGEEIPYRQRNSLSMFLGQNLDSTMSQPSIISIMNSNGRTLMQQQAQALSRRPSQAALKASEKVSNLYETPMHERLANKYKH